MPYRIEIGPKADAQLADAQLAALDTAIATSVERKISWLGENAVSIVHRRLVNMPLALSGLCKLRVGDDRILYWVCREPKLVRLYRIQHRSEVYRDF